MGSSDEPRPDAEPLLALPGRTIVRDPFEDVIDAAATDLFMHATSCVRAFGDFHLALSAGDLQDRLYVRLMVDPKFRELPWARTHLWLVREGACSPAAPGSAYAELRDTLVEHAGLPLGQVHPIEGDRADAADAYERDLRETLAWREPGHDRLDCVVLAAGGGGFEGWWCAARGEANGKPSDRLARREPGEGVSISTRLVNATRLIVVLASGEGGRDPLDTAAMAGAGLAPIGGDLRWYLDSPALRA